jgi:hypothetical protein
MPWCWVVGYRAGNLGQRYTEISHARAPSVRAADHVIVTGGAM